MPSDIALRCETLSTNYVSIPAEQIGPLWDGADLEGGVYASRQSGRLFPPGVCSPWSRMGGGRLAVDVAMLLRQVCRVFVNDVPGYYSECDFGSIER